MLIRKRISSEVNDTRKYYEFDDNVLTSIMMSAYAEPRDDNEEI